MIAGSIILLTMPEEPKMTATEARRILWGLVLGVFALVAALLFALVYGIIHRRAAMISVPSLFLAPLILTFLLRKTNVSSLFMPVGADGKRPLEILLVKHPMFVLVAPLVVVIIAWGILLVTITVGDGDTKKWVRQHSVLTSLWGFIPLLAVAYWCVGTHSPVVGVYIAASVAYMTVATPIGGLSVENGILGFMGSYKTQASPLLILNFSLLFAVSCAILHFAVWTAWPTEYVNMHGFQDALYFSVVTMATVGYGDILPVGHLARWLCMFEIVSGFLLLVVGVSAAMTVWIQDHQTAGALAASPAKPDQAPKTQPARAE
jgi:hypothetical protein